MEPSIAFLSNGKLYVKLAGQEVREVESTFARQALERQAKAQETDGWKSEGGLWGSMGLGRPDLRQLDSVDGVRKYFFRGVAPAEETGQVLYVVDLGNVAGLFHYTLSSDNERRLMHRNDFPARDLARHKRHGTLAVSLKKGDGTACIAISENEGRHLSHVTSGDSVDEAPAWTPDAHKQIVFQSAGVGRNEAGLALGLAPYTIELLDMQAEKVSTLAKDEACDFLAPQLAADGALYFIRRPYKPQGHSSADPWAFLMDVLLFPYRVGRSLVYFLHFFSIFFSGQPLMTAGGPKRLAPDTRYLALWGHLIDTRRAIEKAGREKGADLVPKNWELVRRDAEGKDQVLAQNVLSFGLCENGDVIYTNGTVVYHRDADGAKKTLCDARLIERVTVLW